MKYRQWRHTRGYGVHSPFAFRMITDVVRPGRGYSWYGYMNIDAMVNSQKIGRKLERRARMFHRLLCFLNPKSLFLPAGTNPAFYAAAEGVDSRMKIERKPSEALDCQMIATSGNFIPLESLTRHLRKPGNSAVILDCPPGWIQSLFESIPEGLMLYSGENVIIIHREGMMKVAYDVIL